MTSLDFPSLPPDFPKAGEVTSPATARDLYTTSPPSPPPNKYRRITLNVLIKQARRMRGDLSREFGEVCPRTQQPRWFMTSPRQGKSWGSEGNPGETA
jgi:hypothetical protein